MTLAAPWNDDHRQNGDFDERNAAAALALADAIGRTLGITQQLIRIGRRVDLGGLDRAVGLLCAKTLDQRPDFGRDLRPRLSTLLQQIDELMTAVRQQPGGC